MIILDTNVISEPLRAVCDVNVARWLERQASQTLFVTNISHAEMLFGIALLPDGRRKRDIDAHVHEIFHGAFRGRVMTFGMAEAPAYAQLRADRRRQGRPIAVEDAMIASIAMTHGAAIATRDGDFQDCGVPLINPWEG